MKKNLYVKIHSEDERYSLMFIIFDRVNILDSFTKKREKKKRHSIMDKVLIQSDSGTSLVGVEITLKHDTLGKTS